MENDEGTSSVFGVFSTGSTIAQQLNPKSLTRRVFLLKNSQTYH